MEKQTALITGASGGIGYALAEQFARHGFDLVLVARSVESLQQIAGDFQARYRIAAHVSPFNLSRPDAPGELYHHLERSGIAVDVLVNNAGFGIHGLFHENDIPETMELVQLNVAAATNLAALFLRGMVERNRGGLLTVASTAAFQPGPLMAAYHASKAYILYLTEAIAAEVKGSNVKVSVLCPGPVDTGFQERARNIGSILGNKSLLMMPAEKVARIAYDKFMKGKRIIVPGTLNALGAVLAPRAPRSMVLPVIQFLHRK